MNVLFCTDGSEISFRALRNFSKWARNAEIDAICVVDWSFLPDSVAIEDSRFETSCANVAGSILEKVEFDGEILYPEPIGSDDVLIDILKNRIEDAL